MVDPPGMGANRGPLTEFLRGQSVSNVGLINPAVYQTVVRNDLGEMTA